MPNPHTDHVPPACRTRPKPEAPSANEPAWKRAEPDIPRLALNQTEAARSIGVSVPTFKSLAIPYVPAGTRKLFPVTAIQEWLTANQKPPS